MKSNNSPILSPIQPGLSNKKLATLLMEAAVICLRMAKKHDDKLLETRAMQLYEDSKKWESRKDVSDFEI